MPHPTDAERPRPLTFARVFWQFCAGGLVGSTVGLVLLPRVLVRWQLSESRISAWSLIAWLGLLAVAWAPLARAAIREWRDAMT